MTSPSPMKSPDRDAADELPCPFCGGEAIVSAGYIACANCAARAESDAWNKRIYSASELATLRRRVDPREQRQQAVVEWCAAAFGTEHASSLPQRAVHLLEEAIEAYQAAGADPAMAHKLIDFVFSRPAGTLAQELGGVGLTLLAMAAAAGANADAEEQRELDRVLAKPLAYFTARNNAKNAAGFEVGYRASPLPPGRNEG